jgi:hypothetical protein
MTAVSQLFSISGIALTLLAALRVFAMFERPDIRPELIGHATFLVLCALFSFWFAWRLSKRSPGYAPSSSEPAGLTSAHEFEMSMHQDLI